ncbi:hypothetical protein T4B_6929, partial [Trichinella pseudospiralis]
LRAQFDWTILIFRSTFKSAGTFFSLFCLAFVYANDELLESRRKKLSQLTSYDAQKRDFTKKKYESLQQLLCLSTAIIHWWLIHVGSYQATHEEDGPHHTKIFMLANGVRQMNNGIFSRILWTQHRTKSNIYSRCEWYPMTSFNLFGILIDSILQYNANACPACSTSIESEAT